MFQSVKKFIDSLAGESHAHFEETDHRLAVAALLCHIMAADGVIEPEEKATLRQTLKSHFDLADDEIEDLIADAHDADSEAVDFYTFTSVLKRALDEDGRKDVIRMMWEVVYADGVAHEIENSIVWRVAELLGISNRDRTILRKDVKDKLAAQGE